MRLLFTFLFLLNYFFLFCQTEKGSMLLNFNGHLTHYHANYFNLDEKYFGGIMQMEAGYALLNNLFFGVKYDAFSRMGVPDNNYFSIPNYGIFSRYYFLKNKNRVYLHTDFNHQKGIRAGYHQWNLALGYSYFLSPNAAFEVHFNYNIYNQTPAFIPFDPNDPIATSENNPQGLTIQLQLHYFLPSSVHKYNEQERLPLLDRYLKKGNRYLFLSGDIYHKDIGFIGSFEKTKFLTDDLRINHRFYGFGSFSKDTRLASIDFYLPSLEKYFPVTSRLYYTPSVGIGPSLAFFDAFHFNNFGWMATAQIGFDYFLKNSHFRTGYTFYAADFFTKYTDVYTSSNLYLSGEFFISEKLSIKPEALYKVHGDYIQFFQFEYGRFIDVRKFRLQFGFSYYY